MRDSPYSFEVGQRVRVYRTMAPGRVVSREVAPDPRYGGERLDRYEVDLDGGSRGRYFGRELEVVP